MPPGQHYETVVIGCGLAGIAAALRLALNGREVLLLERHSAPGGLNSFYVHERRLFDTGLHAVTNYAAPGTRGGTLNKILRQLRLPRDFFDLAPQRGSRIVFPGAQLRFSNEFGLLESEVAAAFPQNIDGFRRLRTLLVELDAFDADLPPTPARSLFHEHLRDPLLAELLLCPLFLYGGAQEDELELAQAAILWRAIYEEGFGRPPGGIRPLLTGLLKRYKAHGGQRAMRSGVARLHVDAQRVTEIELDDGSALTADHVISTAGHLETLRLCQPVPPEADRIAPGRISFFETLLMLDRPPSALGWDDTIVFYSQLPRLRYREPAALIDPCSGVVCLPSNYAYPADAAPPELPLRLSCLASFPEWTGLDAPAYRAAKDHCAGQLRAIATELLPALPPGTSLGGLTTLSDSFTPKTIHRYTGKRNGAVYGAPDKVKHGRTPLDNLYIAGTDQGQVGITGALMSGLAIANRFVLSRTL